MRQSEGAESNGRYRLSRVNRASLSGKVTLRRNLNEYPFTLSEENYYTLLLLLAWSLFHVSFLCLFLCSFVCLVGFGLSLLLGSFAPVSGGLLLIIHTERQALKPTGSSVWVSGACQLVELTVTWSGGTLAFSLGSFFLRGCLVFPEESSSLLPGGSERKSDGSRGYHHSFVY